MSDSENDKPRHPKRKSVPSAMYHEDVQEPWSRRYHHDVIVAVSGVAAVTAICLTTIVIFHIALADVPADRRAETIKALADFARGVRNG